MAQSTFKTTNTKVATLAEAKEILKNNEIKNPFTNSSNPFADGQELEFEGFVLVDWESNGKSGQYLALGFVGTDSTISLSCFNRTAYGFTDANLDGTPVKIENPDEGLHSLTKDFQVLDDDSLDEIEKFLTKKGNRANKKVKVQLTTYFTNYYGRASEHTLTNLLK